MCGITFNKLYIFGTDSFKLIHFSQGNLLEITARRQCKMIVNEFIWKTNVHNINTNECVNICIFEVYLI